MTISQLGSFFLFFSLSAFAWNRHDLITQAALNPIDNKSTVEYVPIQDFTRALGFIDVSKFNEAYEINRDYKYETKLGEVRGKKLKSLDVLSAYSAEPDWGMDANLFAETQFPYLWREEYRVMGGKAGPMSQGFRHMFWPAWYISYPLATLKFPLDKVFESMGQAPDRAALFAKLSEKARLKGFPYWSARFFALTLHYLEDISQPFHSSQVPTKKFLTLILSDHEHGDWKKSWITQFDHIVLYYHFCYEAFIADALEKGELREALAKVIPTQISYRTGDILAMSQYLSEVAIKRASDVGRALLNLCPAINEPFVTFDAFRAIDKKWWADIRSANRKQDASRTLELTTGLFLPLGDAVRQVVKSDFR